MPRCHTRIPAPAKPRLAPPRPTMTPIAETVQAVQDSPLGRVSLGPGGVPGARAQAAALHQASGGQLARAGRALLHLQTQYGNRYVQQVVGHARQPAGLVPTPVVQAKLVEGRTEDRYEQQADRVARQVAGALTRTGRAAVHVPAVPRARGTAGEAVDPGVAGAIGRSRAGGRAIPEPVRGPLERALGTDLSEVRVHADARADQLNRALRSRAFTSGQDIFFRRGAYLPERPAGTALLAHEVAHVLQQQAATSAGLVQCFRPEDFNSLDEAQDTPYGEYLYKQLDDPISKHVGQPFSPAQRNNIYDTNVRNHKGKLRSDTDPGQELFLQNTDETPHVDHRFPKSAGGSNSFANAAVLSAATNISKGNRITDVDHDPAPAEALAPYQHFGTHPQQYPSTVGNGRLFSNDQRTAIYNANRQYYNDGEIHSDLPGHETLFGNDSSQIPHVDHITPKVDGGTNYYFNARVISAEENLEKGGGDRPPIGFGRKERYDYPVSEMNLVEYFNYRRTGQLPERLVEESESEEASETAGTGEPMEIPVKELDLWNPRQVTGSRRRKPPERLGGTPSQKKGIGKPAAKKKQQQQKKKQQQLKKQLKKQVQT